MSPSVDPAAVADAIGRVRSRIATLAGDRPVELIAVTKGFGADAIGAAVAGGCTTIGENFAQELIRKLADLAPDVPRPNVHFIGRLQSNKVRSLASIVDVWHTIDRQSLVAEIARRVPLAWVFVQVNTTGEPDKGGCAPDTTADVVNACVAADLVVEGLMTIGPTSGDATATHAAFALLRSLADVEGLAGCSMGMSGDLEIALEHGATHVRIGSALFGERPQRGARIS